METRLTWALLLPDPEHAAAARAVLVAGYGLAAFCWFRAGLPTRPPPDRSLRRWWLLGACVLLFLALNKSLDFRRHVETALRAVAKSEGWYEQRQPEQFLLAIGLPCLMALVVGALLLTQARTFARRQPLAVGGWLLLLAYLALRQSQEWKPVLPWLEAIQYRDWRLALEALGLLLVLIAALRPALPSGGKEDATNSG